MFTIPVPPQPPKIFNEKREYVDGRAGPYEEGGELHLICVVAGGTPPPTITWSHNGNIVTSASTDFSVPYSQSSKLVVHNLSRIHQHGVYTCQASNFNEKVVSTNITIELYRKLPTCKDLFLFGGSFPPPLHIPSPLSRNVIYSDFCFYTFNINFGFL